MGKIRLFVSSVQKELENERVGVVQLITADPFLSANCEPVLYEYEPASPTTADEGYLAVLESCDIHVLIVWREYGSTGDDGLSATHREFRFAREKGMPILAYLKGERDVERETGTQKLIEEIDTKYKRFGNYSELQEELRRSLLDLLKSGFKIEPTSDEREIAEQTLKATSDFEQQLLTRLEWDDLDHDVARSLIASATDTNPSLLDDAEVRSGLVIHGLLWREPDTGKHYATAAGIVMLARDPSAVFPQCRLLCDAYKGNVRDGKPMDQEDVRAPLPEAIDRIVAFIDRNTRHPMRVVGLARVRLDEYPIEALREALVNAAAHRDYGDAGRRIMVERYSDRIEVSSPGMPPPPITIDKLRRGKYRPCSRNPILAQSLSYFHKIEQRGSGMARMRDAMVDHGLDVPKLAADTGFFQVVLHGPGDDVDRLRSPKDATRLDFQPSVEAQLTDRQKQMVAFLLTGEKLTSRVCEQLYGISRYTANQDFGRLLELGIIRKIGSGRSVYYLLAE